jgi:hypothetical protein
MRNNFYNFVLFLILLSEIKSYRADTENKKPFSNDSKVKYDKILTEVAIDLYLPKYDFNKPEKIKDSYTKIHRYINEDKKKNENLRDLFVVPEENILDDEFEYKRRIISELIKKEVNMDETKFKKGLKYYAYPHVSEFENLEFKLLPNDVEILSYSNFDDGIEFEPRVIELPEK